MRRIKLLCSLVILVISQTCWSAPIHDAAAKGDLAELSRLLEQNANLEEPTTSGDTALHYAAVFGHLDVAKLLVGHGADVDAREHSGLTPLCVAARGGHAEVCTFLLSKGARTNVRNEEEPTGPSVVASNGKRISAAAKGIKDYQDAKSAAFFGSLLGGFLQGVAARGVAGPNLLTSSGKIYSTHYSTYIPGSVFTIQLPPTRLLASTNNEEYHTAGRTPLHFAAASGNVAVVRALLESLADPNAEDEDGIKPLDLGLDSGNDEVVSLLVRHIGNTDSLHVATRAGVEDEVQRLLEAGADVKDTDLYGLTALHHAAKNGYTSIAEMLLSNGADINAPSKRDLVYPVWLAAHWGRTDTVRLLLDHKADVYTLLVGVNTLDKDTMRMLLDHNASISPQGYYVKSALRTAQIQGHAEIVAMLTERDERLEETSAADSKLPSVKRLSERLAFAASFGRTEKVKKLLDDGADVNARYEIMPAIFCAARNGHAEIVQVFLDKGANTGGLFNFEGGRGGLIHFAAAGGNPDVIRMLAAKGVDVNTKTNAHAGKQTSLVIAAKAGNLETIRALLEVGATAGKWDVVMIALNSGDIEMLKLILDSGLDMKEKPKKLSPLVTAAAEGHVDIVKLLLERGAEMASIDDKNAAITRAVSANAVECLSVLTDNDLSALTVHSAALLGRVDDLRRLIDGGASASEKGDNEATPLHRAACVGSVECAALLIEKGAKVNAADGVGLTPLHYAALERQTSVVKLLVEHGAKVDATDQLGMTPLSWAACSGSIDAARHLLECSANVKHKSKDGATPVLWAARSGDIDMFRLLIRRGALSKMDGEALLALKYAAQSGRGIPAYRILNKLVGFGS